MADVRALEGDRSCEARAEIARRFGRQLDALNTSGHAPLVAAVLELLLQDVTRTVREALAETAAHAVSLPRDAALRLAEDAIDVARPILEHSPVLEDADLLRIVHTHALQHALAIAARSHLSEVVSGALVETGEREVVARVVANAGAVLSHATLRRVADDWTTDETVQAGLIQRPALPFELVEQLVGAVGDRLEWDLVRTRRIGRDEAQALMRATRERAAFTLVTRDHADRSLEPALRRRHAEGSLSPDAVVIFLRDGDIASFEAALGLLAGVELRHCRALLYGPDRRSMAALCVRAGLPIPHYIAIRMALELAARAVDGKSAPQAYSRDMIQFVQAQYERLRQEPATVEQLCRSPA